ncbi:uncharacterized protein LOC119837127 [Zerene cesonia]|uniref:uncharacterized protein LOC119837127 n=1 Tax=Zerene cesonia TaxID=33412 RepID=UPI0018E51BB0|nr:uncharacterized protein LOC119837127 [Zerene cesonia]XP_038218563.1 uncharacterized protein LOC119837127 [Zerene cesonia]
MKSLILFLGLLLVTLSNGAVVKSQAKNNLTVGYIASYDRLLYRQYLQKLPVPNAIQYQDFMFRGTYGTRISAVTAHEIGYTQYASAWIVAGGVGYNYVTVRLQTARGGGFNFVIDVWGY